jgi:hypothetical protein
MCNDSLALIKSGDSKFAPVSGEVDGADVVVAEWPEVPGANQAMSTASLVALASKELRVALVDSLMVMTHC